MPVILTLGRLRQEDLKLEASLGCMRLSQKKHGLEMAKQEMRQPTGNLSR
jgi:hypothetical protein